MTRCVSGRRPILASPAVAETVIDCLAFMRKHGRLKLLTFMIMPDHDHAQFVLILGTGLPELMQRRK